MQKLYTRNDVDPTCDRYYANAKNKLFANCIEIYLTANPLKRDVRSSGINPYLRYPRRDKILEILLQLFFIDRVRKYCLESYIRGFEPSLRHIKILMWKRGIYSLMRRSVWSFLCLKMIVLKIIVMVTNKPISQQLLRAS